MLLTDLTYPLVLTRPETIVGYLVCGETELYPFSPGYLAQMLVVPRRLAERLLRSRETLATLLAVGYQARCLPPYQEEEPTNVAN